MQPIIPLIVTCVTVLMTLISTVHSKNYVADVRFYVDATGYQIFKSKGVTNLEELTGAVQLIVNDLNNKYYNSLAANQVNLRLRLEKVVYDDEIVRGRDGAIHAKGAMMGFEDYLMVNNQYSSSFDLTLLLTGLDLYEATRGTYGMAYLGTICRASFRSGVSEVTGELNHDGLAVAHELGHIFGAGHDNSCPRGQGELGNIMYTPNYFNHPLRFKFSYCSAIAMWRKFSSLDHNCMEDTSTPAPATQAPTPAPTTPPPTTQAPTTRGTTIVPVKPSTSETPDQACQRLAGNDFRLYRIYYNLGGYGDTFCKALYCLSNIYTNEYKISSHATPDGIPCATNKRCKSGKCVASAATPFNEKCPWGDHDITVFNYAACSAASCGAQKWQNNYCCTFCTPLFP